MLFNSYIFIFVFLPLTLLLFHSLRTTLGFRAAIFFLVCASLSFYAWWSFKYLMLLGVLIVLNYIAAQGLIRFKERSRFLARGILAVGILTNLSVLGYFKYANFLADNINAWGGPQINLPAIILPIGISFFTFQKIAFLVDVYHQKVSRIKFLDYSLFVSFFPQLIAGPITHHSELISQFTRAGMQVTSTLFRQGVSIFIIGLAKKVILADTAAKFATPVFQAVAAGQGLDAGTAWTGALAYTVQLYFDFSAYSDMAIGIGLMFGIRLPINFDSPYKSTSIVDFWRRWHMTLSRFLRDYLYIPLGGNRKGPLMRYVNLLLTMTLGGIWHGAGWTFLAWGLLHGTYLIVNHGWRRIWPHCLWAAKGESLIFRLMSWAVTFLAVVVGWVFFRSANLESAFAFLTALTGGNGWSTPGDSGLWRERAGWGLLTVVMLLILTWTAPNTQQIFGYVGPESLNKNYESQLRQTRWTWHPTLLWALWLAGLLTLSLTMLTRVSEFIYFQF